jgi:hypothetical protein
MAGPAFSDDAVRNATGHGWDAGADRMDHKAIALWLQDEHDVPGWWAQSVTVEFERRIGRREPGQTQQGDYQVSVSRTVPSSLDGALDAWTRHVAGADGFDGVRFEREARVSRTAKWRYWRAGLADGSRISIVVGEKDDSRVVVTASHEKIPDAEAKEKWRGHWKKEMTAFTKALGH